MVRVTITISMTKDYYEVVVVPNVANVSLRRAYTLAGARHISGQIKEAAESDGSVVTQIEKGCK